jgi:hypothetical protein
MELYMHQDPEHNEYDDDDYNYYPHENYDDFFKEFGKLTPEEINEKWQAWIENVLDDLLFDGATISFNPKFPVSDSSKGAEDQPPLYLGMGHNGLPIWKTFWFKDWGLYNVWKSHMNQHSAYILKEPTYYKNLYEIMN